MKNIKYTILDEKSKVTCRADTNGVYKACKCSLDIDRTDEKLIWTITSWFTTDKLKHQGLGKRTMYELMSYCRSLYDMPDEIEYIWNGANEYVLDWLTENFDAICKCPIAVQKTQADDDWDSHKYILNRDKVLIYFGL